MLSIYTLKSASEASNYYQQGDYSTLLGAEERSEWFGKGAELLGLKGPVDHAVFKKLLEGYLPNGAIMHQTLHGQHHRPGYDLTFSAPKSVSILGLVGGNKAVLEAFEQSVYETLSPMEEVYAATRKKEEGALSLEKTKNWTFALFKHVDTRAGDPGSHIHAVLLNMTLTEEKIWRTIFGDYLYRDKLLNGLQCRAALAPKLLSMGYELVFKPKGLFEIKGLEPLIEHFSKRSEAIQSDLESRGESGGLAASRANLRTRTPKKNHDPATRIEHWQQDIKELGFSLAQFEQEVKARGPVPLPDPEVAASFAMEAALEHLSEFLPSFSVPELITTAGKLSLYPHDKGDFLKIIEAKIQDKSLVVRGEHVVSRQRLVLEEAVKAHASQTKPVLALVSPWFREWTAKRVWDGSFDLKTLVAWLGSTDPQLMIKADDQQGLKNLIHAYCKIARSQYAYPRVLCQRVQDVEALEAQMPHQPVHSIEGFLSSCAYRIAAQKPIHPWLKFTQYDRAKAALDSWTVLGHCTLGQVQRLQEASRTLGARLIFASHHPSHTHAFLETLKLPLLESRCHEKSTSPEVLVKAFDEAASQSRVKEIRDPADRLKEAIHCVATAASLSPLVVLSPSEAIKANQAIREALVEQGRLSGPVLESPILKAIPLSNLQKSQVHHYQIGDWLCLKDADNHHPSYWRVEASCTETGLLELSSKTNALWECKPADKQKDFSVFREEQRSLQVGDQIQWSRSFKYAKTHTGLRHRSQEKAISRDRIKDQRALVLAVDPATQSAQVRLKNGVEIRLDLQNKADQHWDYAYATTLHQAPSTLATSVLLLDHQKMDERVLASLHQALKRGSLSCLRIFCSNLSAIKTRVLEGAQIHTFEQSPYQRKDALASDPTLNTHPLFPGLEKAYLEAKGSNPALERASKTMEPMDVALRLGAEAVDRACVGAFERAAVLSRESLKAKAAFIAGAKVSFETLDRVFDRALKEGWLHVVGNNADGELLLTTRHILLIEKLCRREIIESQDQVKPLFAKDALTLQDLKGDPHLTQGQKEAISLVLSTPHRLVAVQGVAGAGKTTALKTIREKAESIGFKPVVLANLSAAKEKAKDSSGGMQAMTTALFLSQSTRALRADPLKARLDYAHQLLILDEASVTSTDGFFELINGVKALGTRLVVIGDFKQLGSIRWGLMFHDLIAYGLKTAVMRENVRLKNLDAFKTLQHSYAGNIAGALSSLGSRFKEIPDKEEALQYIIERCQRSALSNKKTWAVVPGNQDRLKVNEGIRQHLISQGSLQGPSLETAILVSVDRLDGDKKYLDSYKPSDILLFDRSPNATIKAGSYWQIQVMEAHRLLLRSETGQMAYWQPKDLRDPDDLNIYQAEGRSFCVGERIVFSRNQEKLGLINGEFGTILSIEGNKLSLELKDRCVVLDLGKRSAQHLDYAYALTTCKIQGQEDPVIAYGESPRPYERVAQHLRVGDQVTLSKEHTGKDLSEWAIVQTIVQGSKIHLVSEETRKPWGPENTPALFEYQKGSFELVFFKPEKGLCRLTPPKLPQNFPLQAFFKGNLEKGSAFLRADKEQALIRWFEVEGCTLPWQTKLELLDSDKKVSTVLTSPDSKWSYQPPFEQRKPYEIPASSNQQALTVILTRSDDVTVVTGHARDFQKSVELQAMTQGSAASFRDPHWKALHQKVDRLVAHIESQPQKQAALKVELEALSTIQKRDAAWRADVHRPDYDKQAWAQCDAIVDRLLKQSDPSIPIASASNPREEISNLIKAMRGALKESQAHRQEARRVGMQTSDDRIRLNSRESSKNLEGSILKNLGQTPSPPQKDRERER